MTQKNEIITVVGGSGFVGRYVVKHLAEAGYRVRVICRNPDAALHLKTAGDPGQILLVSGNIGKPESLAGKLDGSFAVMNLVGVLFEKGTQNFASLQAKGAATLAKVAKAAGAERFIHMSALGVDKAFGSEYARTKLEGEKAVLAAFPAATILRPSVIFGAEDNFFNQFARMPILPLIGGGKTRFQPVYVDDVARALLAAVERADTQGNIYELGGMTTYSFRALMDYINATLRTRKPLIKIPFGLAMLMGLKWEIISKISPFRPLITRDQVRLLRHDNVVSAGAKTFADLGITPQPLELIVPKYLARFHPKKVL